MISEQPLVQRLDTVESLVDQLFPQRVESNMDWRAKKLKDLIDLNPAKIHDSLGDVCSQLRLSLLQGFEKGFYGLFRLTPVEFRRMWHRSQVTA